MSTIVSNVSRESSWFVSIHGGKYGDTVFDQGYYCKKTFNNLIMADVLDIDNAEEFEVDDEGDRKFNILSWVIHKRVTFAITSLLRDFF